MLSVIIPAHNEAQVLAGLLNDLLLQEAPCQFEVIVVDAASTDDTWFVAASYKQLFEEARIRYVLCRSKHRFKYAALNTGDEYRTLPCSAYIDADVRLSNNVLRCVWNVLEATDGPALVSPSLHVAKQGSVLAQKYWHTWEERQVKHSRVIGAGFYAVNAKGRQLWDKFPQIDCDDGFVASHFDEGDQNKVCSKCRVSIYPPASLVETVLVRARWFRASRALASTGRNVANQTGGAHRTFVYVGATLAAMMLSYLPSKKWYVSRSSRTNRSG